MDINACERELGSAGISGRTMPGSEAASDVIAGMKDYAMVEATSRKRIMSTLEAYGKRSGRTDVTRAAGRAISEILAVSMLEALKY